MEKKSQYKARVILLIFLQYIFAIIFSSFSSKFSLNLWLDFPSNFIKFTNKFHIKQRVDILHFFSKFALIFHPIVLKCPHLFQISAKFSFNLSFHFLQFLIFLHDLLRTSSNRKSAQYSMYVCICPCPGPLCTSARLTTTKYTFSDLVANKGADRY